MTQPSSPGIGLAFAVQTAKGVPITSSASFKKVRVNNASLGIQQAVGRFPQEVGGTYHPGGEYKMFYAGAGNVNWSPRLAGDIGYLLYALMGSVASSGTSDAQGVYTTTFQPAADHCSHPWLSLRRFIPSCTTGDVGGEYMYDAKVSGMAISLAAGGPATADLAFLSINAGTASDASDWDTDMTGAYESTDSVILAPASAKPVLKAVTGIDLGGGVASDYSIPTLALQLGIANTFSADGIRPELVIGSYQPDDAVLTGQTMSFQITYKWANQKLYRDIYNYGHDAYAWSPHILYAGAEFALRSPRLIGTSNVYEEMLVKLTECSLSCPQGITLVGGQFLTVNITGTAKAQATPAGYGSIVLKNGKAYTDLGVTYSA